jgi:hypothetical protein
VIWRFWLQLQKIERQQFGALAKYLVEAILPNKSVVAKRKSIIAAAYCLAGCMLGIGE